MSIPKVIHYCWFGKNDLSSLAIKCIDSWKKFCPDYEIILWNEDNFDISCNDFVKEAFEMNKWAFVSDYARLYVLYHYGGIYMDADVELVKNIDDILDNRKAVTGYQEDITIPAALMAAEPHNVWIKRLLDYYDDRHFIMPDGSLDFKTNSEIITVISCKKFGFRIGDSFIREGEVHILPSVYLAPYKKTIFKLKNQNIYDIYKIDNELTYAIHHAVGSWTPRNNVEKIKGQLFGLMRIILTERLYTKLKGIILRKKMRV